MYEYLNVTIDDINYMIESKTLKKIIATKNKTVHASQIQDQALLEHIHTVGVKTYVIDDATGEGTYLETVNKNCNLGDYIVTQEVGHNNTNQYIVPKEKFEKSYYLAHPSNKWGNEGVYTPHSSEKVVYVLPKGLNIEFIAPWGSTIKVRECGVVVPDGNGYYGINHAEFVGTHTILSQE